MGRAKNFRRNSGCESDFCDCTRFVVFSDSPCILFSFFSLSFTPTYTTFATASLLGIIRCGEERSPDNANECTFLRKTQNTAGHTPRYTCGTEQFQPANVKEEPTRQLQLCILKNNKLKFHPLHIQRQWVLVFIVEYV